MSGVRLELTPHSDTPSRVVESLEVGIVRETSGLSLAYIVRGNVAALRIAEPVSPQRRDGLWQRTCFEIFLRPPTGESYCEFNLSPSTEWSAYRLEGYRAGMHNLAVEADPEIMVEDDRRHLQLVASLDLAGVDLLEPDGAWRVGLSAVIVEKDGTKTYWALAHPPGVPDFHHPDCFALELPAAKPA